MSKLFFTIVHFFMNLYYSIRLSFYGVNKAVFGDYLYPIDYKIKRKFWKFSLVREIVMDENGNVFDIYEYGDTPIRLLERSTNNDYVEVPTVTFSYDNNNTVVIRNRLNGKLYYEKTKDYVRDRDISGKLVKFVDLKAKTEEVYNYDGKAIKKTTVEDGCVVEVDTSVKNFTTITRRNLESSTFVKETYEDDSLLSVYSYCYGDFRGLVRNGEYKLYKSGNLIETGTMKNDEYDGLVMRKIENEWVKMYYCNGELVCSEFVKENENVSEK